MGNRINYWNNQTAGRNGEAIYAGMSVPNEGDSGGLLNPVSMSCVNGNGADIVRFTSAGSWATTDYSGVDLRGKWASVAFDCVRPGGTVVTPAAITRSMDNVYQAMYSNTNSTFIDHSDDSRCRFAWQISHSEEVERVQLGATVAYSDTTVRPLNATHFDISKDLEWADGGVRNKASTNVSANSRVLMKSPSALLCSDFNGKPTRFFIEGKATAAVTTKIRVGLYTYDSAGTYIRSLWPTVDKLYNANFSTLETLTLQFNEGEHHFRLCFYVGVGLTVTRAAVITADQDTIIGAAIFQIGDSLSDVMNFEHFNGATPAVFDSPMKTAYRWRGTVGNSNSIEEMQPYDGLRGCKTGEVFFKVGNQHSWFPAPDEGMTASNTGWGAFTQLTNGFNGGVASAYEARTYSMNWSMLNRDQAEQFRRLFLNAANKNVFFYEPFAEENVVSPMLGMPALQYACYSPLVITKDGVERASVTESATHGNGALSLGGGSPDTYEETVFVPQDRKLAVYVGGSGSGASAVLVNGTQVPLNTWRLYGNGNETEYKLSIRNTNSTITLDFIRAWLAPAHISSPSELSGGFEYPKGGGRLRVVPGSAILVPVNNALGIFTASLSLQEVWAWQ